MTICNHCLCLKERTSKRFIVCEKRGEMRQRNETCNQFIEDPKNPKAVVKKRKPSSNLLDWISEVE